MPRDLWQETFSNIEALLTILNIAENRVKQYNTYQKEEDNKFYNNDHILESISTFFYSLASEINKAFQNMEAYQEVHTDFPSHISFNGLLTLSLNLRNNT
jgi:uncharacterized protein (DUF2225 family)